MVDVAPSPGNRRGLWCCVSISFRPYPPGRETRLLCEPSRLLGEVVSTFGLLTLDTRLQIGHSDLRPGTAPHRAPREQARPDTQHEHPYERRSEENQCKHQYPAHGRGEWSVVRK